MNAGLPGNLTAASRRESSSRTQEPYSPAHLNDTGSNPERERWKGATYVAEESRPEWGCGRSGGICGDSDGFAMNPPVHQRANNSELLSGPSDPLQKNDLPVNQ